MGTIKRFGRSWEQEDWSRLATAMVFLDSLIQETHSPDTLWLVGVNAAARAKELGVDEDTIQDVLGRLISYARDKQRSSPLSSLF